MRVSVVPTTPVVSSLDSLAQYLQVQGREWERFAWMKSRIVAPRPAIDNHSGRQLRQVVLPFVFRRYLDFNVYESLRVLHDQIRNHAIARSAGRPERANDVKISRGGILSMHRFCFEALMRLGSTSFFSHREQIVSSGDVIRSYGVSLQSATCLVYKDTSR